MSALAVEAARFCPRPGAHYLHPQISTRVPRRFVFIDTEAHRSRHADVEAQTWRLGVTGTVHWRTHTKKWSPLALLRHTTPESLWGAVSDFTRPKERTVVVAHNMGYDLRISRGLEVLPEMGWKVSKLTLSVAHITVDLEMGERKLVLVDSYTVLPRKLEDIGSFGGPTKAPLPSEDETDGAWWQRCEGDVSLLAWAYLEVVDWLDRDDLGGWARTGSGIGWHTMLRRHLTDNVLVHGDKDLADLEGRSCYAGRCEVWRWGYQDQGPYVEWDYELAYAGIMREVALPSVYRDHVYGMRLERMVADRSDDAYLVNAQIDATVPVLPFRDNRGIVWPVGRFSGWWWHWELALAESVGVGVRVLGAHRYSTAPWLQSWAEWCTEVVADRSSPEARVRAVAAKHWQRSLVGRSAMRFADWRNTGDAWVPGLSYAPIVEHGTGKRGAALMLAEQRFEAWDSHWWDSALPQVLSAVMAHCRVKLWAAMEAAGAANVVYLDSDCVVTNPAGTEALERATRAGLLPGLRRKASHASIEPLAPQLVEGSTYRRLAGVPRGARRTGPVDYEAEHWEGLTTTLAGGDTSTVKVKTYKAKLTVTDWRRAHLPDGSTRPYVVTDDVRELPEGITR